MVDMLCGGFVKRPTRLPGFMLCPPDSPGPICSLSSNCYIFCDFFVFILWCVIKMMCIGFMSSRVLSNSLGIHSEKGTEKLVPPEVPLHKQRAASCPSFMTEIQVLSDRKPQGKADDTETSCCVHDFALFIQQ